MVYTAKELTRHVWDGAEVIRAARGMATEGRMT
jgi:hypothetical protein